MSHYNARRLAKNTIALYARTFVTLLISLYTSRIVLNTLGVEDFGVYNVVAGVVMLFVFLNSAMASGTQRFLNYEIGQGDSNRVNIVFSSSLKIHFLIAIIILLLSETIGLWFVNYKLVIPEGRMNAANWVYQFAILSTMISLVQVPYMASVIANEKMQIYAYVGLLEAVLKLVIVYLLVMLNYDKLILYAIMSFIVQLLVIIMYVSYCRKKFVECKYIKPKDKRLYKDMLSFSSWNLFASIATVSKGQGLNMILNLFFGPVVNAARAVSMSISGVTNQFVGGFMTAANPQITKTYSSGNKSEFEKLIFRSSKFAFYLLSLVTIPILAKTQLILELWLVNPPQYSALFIQLVLIDALIVSVAFPLTSSAQATGNIKRFHVTVTFFELLNLPVSYILLKLGYPPESVYVVTILMSILALIARLIVLRKLTNLPVKKFMFDILLKCWVVFGLTFTLQHYINFHHTNVFITIIVTTVLSSLILLFLIYLIGLNRDEKRDIYSMIQAKIKNKNE
ncbi:MAG: MATE family efflux transporter [Bacteroidales bacterium]